MKKGISIILCCYNSELKLPQTLQCIINQKYNNSNIEVEIILVDNNSKDDTQIIASNYWNANGIESIQFKIVEEKRPGLSYARHTGVQNANCDLILFCDDDNWLDEKYCQQAHDIMQSNCKIGVLGGLNTAVGEVELPSWFKGVEQSYACGPQNEFDGEASRMYITGAGMVLRKRLFDVFEQVSFESQLTDRKGEELSSGGDSEICHVAILLGYTLFYSSNLKLFHFMEAKRLNWNYFVKMLLGHAESSYKLRYYFDESRKNNWLSELFRIIRPILGKRLVVLARDFFYAKKNIVYGEKIHHIFLFGQLLSHVESYNNYFTLIKNIKELKYRIKKYNAE